MTLINRLYNTYIIQQLPLVPILETISGMSVTRPVVPNLFCSRAIYFFLDGMRGHKVKFRLYSSQPPPLSPSPPTARVSGERCKLPIGAWGGAPADNAF